MLTRNVVGLKIDPDPELFFLDLDSGIAGI